MKHPALIATVSQITGVVLVSAVLVGVLLWDFAVAAWQTFVLGKSAREQEELL